MDIEKYFDTVNQNKLISTHRKRVKDKGTLHLICSFLKAGIMENGITKRNQAGVPQGSPISPVLLDKELEKRGLRFARYADDVWIFVKRAL